MNRVEMIQEILSKLKFIHLLTTNELLSRVLGVYLEIETFFIDFLKNALDLEFEVSSYFPDLEQPFEIEDKKNKIIVHLMLDNNEEDLLNAIESYNEMVKQNPLYEEWNFYVLMLGLNKLKLRNILNTELQHMIQAGRVITPKEIINQIRKMRSMEDIESLMDILISDCTEPLDHLKCADKDFLSILSHLSNDVSVELLTPTILPLKLRGYVDNLMSFNEAKLIDPEIYDSIISLYSSYSKIDRPLFDLLNNVYSLVRKYWVLSDPLGKNTVKNTIEDVTEKVSNYFLERELVDSRESATRCAKAIIYEALLREKISLIYY